MKSQTTRRAALATAGLGVLAAAGFSPRLNAADMGPIEKANVQLVNDFCASWPGHEPTKIMLFFADNCAYRMTETMEPNKGRDAVTSRVTALASTVQGFEVLDTVPYVITAVRIADVGEVHVVKSDAVPNPNWLRPGGLSAGQQAFGNDLLRRHRFVAIPSAVSTHSWNLIFDPLKAAGFYSLEFQEPFALDTRLHPPA